MNSAHFTNCIIDGSLTTEIEFQENSSGAFNYTFDHCLIKIDPNTNTSTANYINIIKNENPEFDDKAERDFHLTATSPCIDAGDPSDLDPDGTRIDIGALWFGEEIIEPGDCNSDSIINILDVVYLINDCILNGNNNCSCGDINQDNIVNVLDLSLIHI